MNDNKTEFPEGLFVKAPHEKAPDWVIGTISIKRKHLGNWLRGKRDEWINLDIKLSRNGKWYACVNTYKKPDKPAESNCCESHETASDRTSQNLPPVTDESRDRKDGFYDDDIPFVFSSASLLGLLSSGYVFAEKMLSMPSGIIS